MINFDEVTNFMFCVQSCRNETKKGWKNEHLTCDPEWTDGIHVW